MAIILIFSAALMLTGIFARESVQRAPVFLDPRTGREYRYLSVGRVHIRVEG